MSLKDPEKKTEQNMLAINRAKVKLKKFIRFLSIPRREIVLDVGSGDGPFARANVLCDRYISDTENRVGPIHIDRPFVAGDIMSLPFKDKAFDYVYCSHVLEHVDDPERAIKELMRIGRRGYIETPSEFLEKIKSSPGHKWYIRLNNGRLVFREKGCEVFDSLIEEVAEKKLINKDKSFMDFYWNNYYTLFNIPYEWSGTIGFEVIRLKKDGEQTISSPDGAYNRDDKSLEEKYEGNVRCRFSGIGGLKYFLKYLVKKVYVKEVNLSNLLVCPTCKGPIDMEGLKRICYNCKRGFYVRDGIPVMLENHSFEI